MGFVLPETPEQLAELGFGYEPPDGTYTFQIQKTPVYKAEQGEVLFTISPIMIKTPHPQDVGKKCRDFRIPLHEDWGRRQLRDLGDACGVPPRAGPDGRAMYEEGDFVGKYFQAEVSYSEKKKEIDKKTGKEVERQYIRYNRLTPATPPGAAAVPAPAGHPQGAPQQPYQQPQQFVPQNGGYQQPYQQQPYQPAPQPYQQPQQGQPYQQPQQHVQSAPAAAPPGAYVPQQQFQGAPQGAFVPPAAFGPQTPQQQPQTPPEPRGARNIPSGDS